jgi:aspartate kinase
MKKTKVYKFGGASIKTPSALQNVAKIINGNTNIVVVVSAIDKTTNKLELLTNAVFKKHKSAKEIFQKIKTFHTDFIIDAFKTESNNVLEKSASLFSELESICNNQDNLQYDVLYDSIVPYGELLSSLILHEHLCLNKLPARLIDIREHIITDSNNRDAKILWEESLPKIKKAFEDNDVFITQGFIGKDKNGLVTTLGREGSDYTASALAYLLDAEDVTIWKDVPGIMNADPAWCTFAEKLDELSFREAIELAFYGAKVIHPKTIKPIENKNIPLYVKSFDNPNEAGTVIKKLDYKLELIPVYILKSNQILLSASPKDFSFIVEENISVIFGLFAKYKVKVNIMQNSAISLSVSIDNDCRNFDAMISELKEDFFVRYNTNMDLITIRYYNEDSILKMTEGKKVLLEQRSRKTARFVLES